MGADWRPHAPFLTAGPCLLAVPQVYKGVWRGTATMNGNSGPVSLDYQGNVNAN